MIFKPAQLGMAKLDPQELEADKKACRKIGPCGVGKKALYLNSFYIDRRYYLPYGSITRVFKRVAMSSGGFSGKGVFASMAYLVVEYDGGKQKQCNFKDERDVDALLEVLAKEQPNIPRLSAAGEAEITRQKAEKAAQHPPRRRRRQLHHDRQHRVHVGVPRGLLLPVGPEDGRRTAQHLDGDVSRLGVPLHLLYGAFCPGKMARAEGNLKLPLAFFGSEWQNEKKKWKKGILYAVSSCTTGPRPSGQSNAGSR